VVCGFTLAAGVTFLLFIDDTQPPGKVVLLDDFTGPGIDQQKR
jgi:hypothetical protein